VELTGNHSVMPSTTPKIMALIISKNSVIFASGGLKPF
jgi:hypothetical protein